MYRWARSGRKWKIKSEIISKFTFQVYHGAPVLPAHMIYCGSRLRLSKLWVFKELDVMDFPLFDLVFTLSILTSATLLLKDVFYNRKHCP